jgi:hypothetical protein
MRHVLVDAMIAQERKKDDDGVDLVREYIQDVASIRDKEEMIKRPLKSMDKVVKRLISFQDSSLLENDNLMFFEDENGEEFEEKDIGNNNNSNNENEDKVIERLCELGFSKEQARDAYFSANKDENEAAINLLGASNGGHNDVIDLDES